MTKPILDVHYEDDEILFRLRSTTGVDSKLYNLALDGSRYDIARRVNKLPAVLDQIELIFARMREAGIDLKGSEQFLMWFKEERSLRARTLADAHVRVEAVDARMRERGLALYPFQKEDAVWLAQRRSALLGSEMGVGKTLQTLCAIPEAPVLVVAPALAKGVWRDEAAKFRPDLNVEVLDGRGSFRWPKGPRDVVVCNPEILPAIEYSAEAKWGKLTSPLPFFKSPGEVWGHIKKSYQRGEDFNEAGYKKTRGRLRLVTRCEAGLPPVPPGVTCVIDEAHMYSHASSARTMKMKLFAEGIREEGGTTWALTGTPLMNEPRELYTLLELLGRELDVFGSWKNFVRLFHGSQNYFKGWVWGTPEPEVRPRLARVMLRRERKDVLPDLPEKTYRMIKVPLDHKTRKLCDETWRILELLGIDLNNLEAIVEASKNEKLLIETVAQMRKALAAVKTPALLELVREYEAQEEPLVVFSAHREPVEACARRKGWAIITGDVPSEERKRIEREFQAGRFGGDQQSAIARGVAATIQAGGVAITLTRACHVVFVDELWNPSLNSQAQDRCCRIGQTRGVVITRLVGDHNLDVHIANLLHKKERLISASLGGT